MSTTSSLPMSRQVTTAALVAAGLLYITGLDTQPYPFIGFPEQLDCCKIFSDNQNPYYDLIKDELSIEEQIESIHQCVSDILEHTVDLDPKITSLIDDHFWDLG
jgi:hypothetical protein